MANKRPISKPQRQAIGGMWADYHHPQGEDVIACEHRFRVDVPAADHNPAELVCRLMAEAFEQKAEQLRQLARQYAVGVPVPVMSADEAAQTIADMHAKDDAEAVASLPERPGVVN